MVCWFKEIKAHTSRPARWILINLPYINCMLSGITELNAEHKCSFCLGEWNKKLLRISIGSHRCSRCSYGNTEYIPAYQSLHSHARRFSLIMYNTAKFKSPGISDDQAEGCHVHSLSHSGKWIPLPRVISVIYNKKLIHNVTHSEMQNYSQGSLQGYAGAITILQLGPWWDQDQMFLYLLIILGTVS